MIGGLLVAVSWRWVFLVNVPIGVIALVVGWYRLPDVPGHPAPRPDALGTVLVTAGVGSLTFALVKGNHWGWGTAATWGRWPPPRSCSAPSSFTPGARRTR